MKLRLLAVIATMLLSFSALAYVFTPPSRVVTLPGRITVEIINNTYRPIACSGQIDGFKAYGHQVLPFHNVIVPAGASFPVNLFAVGAPFVNSTYNLGCYFIGW
jgi:hypothetical protein